jgi:hypothetical protein
MGEEEKAFLLPRDNSETYVSSCNAYLCQFLNSLHSFDFFVIRLIEWFGKGRQRKLNALFRVFMSVV